MNLNNEILSQQISEQIALEEHLCHTLEDQIEDSDISDFTDAKLILISIKEKLDIHYITLNKLLNEVDLNLDLKSHTTNGVNHIKLFEKDLNNRKISRMLRDDYSALNKITMSNTLLHTIGLALKSSNVASIALAHLEDLAPLVVKIGEMVPAVVTRELNGESSLVDQSIAEIALKNTKGAWKRKSQ